jgi:hypothetical protein
VVWVAYWHYQPKPQASVTAPQSHISAVGHHQVSVAVYINTAGQNINAAQVYLKFDPSIARVVAVKKTNSIFGLWIKNEPNFSNSDGTISFAGGMFPPGFTGSGQIGSVIMSAKSATKLELSFTSQTQALLDDGQGTPIKLQLQPIEVSIP